MAVLLRFQKMQRLQLEVLEIQVVLGRFVVIVGLEAMSGEPRQGLQDLKTGFLVCGRDLEVLERERLQEIAEGGEDVPERFVSLALPGLGRRAGRRALAMISFFSSMILAASIRSSADAASSCMSRGSKWSRRAPFRLTAEASSGSAGETAANSAKSDASAPLRCSL